MGIKLYLYKYKQSFHEMLLACKVSLSQVVPLGRYVQMFVPIIMYGYFLLLKQKVQCLQNFKYAVACRGHKLHISAKFHDLTLFGY